MTFEINNLGQPVGQIVEHWQPAQMPPHATLQGKYCRLEPVDIEKHAQELFDANVENYDGSMWTYLPYGPFESFEQYRDWMETTCCDHDPLFFAIIENTTNKAVGLAAYLHINAKDGSIEVGHLAYSPALQRKPAATEAMFLMMAKAFELGYRRYEWKCNALNLPSRSAAQRLGFSYEGEFRQATIVKGRNRNTTWYAIIDKEWPALRAAFEQWLAPDNFDGDGQQRQRLSSITAPLLFKRG